MSISVIFGLSALGGYLLGSIPFGLVLTKMCGLGDIRKIGSGNIGATNVLRTGRKDLALLTVLLDASKAGIAAFVAASLAPAADYVFLGNMTQVNVIAGLIAGSAGVVGHNFPVWLKFKGGKGIASTLGMFSFALCCEYWWMIFVVLGILVLTLFYIWASEWGSMGSLLGVSSLAAVQGILFCLRYAGEETNGFVVAIFLLLLFDCFLTWFAHRRNILALLAGEEHRTSVKKLSHGKKEARG